MVVGSYLMEASCFASNPESCISLQVLNFTGLNY